MPLLVRRPWLLRASILTTALLLLGVLVWSKAMGRNHRANARPVASAKAAQPEKAPELDGGVAWLNTAGPIKLKDLRGKIVILDFWTFCCINCIHMLPDLAKLEAKYPNQVVVIGVHSAKFDTEKVTENIRKAMLRYQITHPVVNDANMAIWQAYGVTGWPTLAVIDPEGNYLGQESGEGQFELLDKLVAALIKKHRANGTLNEKPKRFDLARYREKGDTPLFFPGKVLADGPGNRLAITDSTHHRVVITDLNGQKIAIAGTGAPGWKDGPFATAQFDDPQGLALSGNTLYVADRKNHLIRALDLKSQTVSTVAGTGQQDRMSRYKSGEPRKIGLNSPWGLLLIGDTLYIAMAGHHQIWALDLKKSHLAPYAGSGFEDIRDGSLDEARFAQPSGLTTDGKHLFVADSEASAVRSVGLPGQVPMVETLVGEGLFKFGDTDGVGPQVRLQHALGVAYADGKLFVADTYNSTIKVLDPATKRCTTFLGGDEGGWFGGPLFNEPAGLSYANGKLYVADTNAHRIRVVDVKTKTVRTLQLKGVEPPAVK